jgi:hypothetical protein
MAVVTFTGEQTGDAALQQHHPRSALASNTKTVVD